MFKPPTESAATTRGIEKVELLTTEAAERQKIPYRYCLMAVGENDTGSITPLKMRTMIEPRQKAMTRQNDERALCRRCARDYENAGYTLIKIWQKYKEPCCKCDGWGWTYEVKKEPPD